MMSAFKKDGGYSNDFVPTEDSPKKVVKKAPVKKAAGDGTAAPKKTVRKVVKVKKPAVKKEEPVDEVDDFLGLDEEPKEEEPKDAAAADLADLDFGVGEEPKEEGKEEEEEEQEKPAAKKPVAKKPVAKKVVKKVVRKVVKKEEPVDEVDDFLGLGDESKEEEPKGNAADDLADLDFGMAEEKPKEEEE